jgi:NAD(P)-dependent dehydrogenase (short-subunit alcohol dehydrogenase family)
MAEIIGRRIFTGADLRWFAAASGDWNPIHVDPVQARRTVAGDVVIHGMFTLLWALDRHAATAAMPPQRIAARFHRPLLPDEPLAVSRSRREDDVVRLAVSRKGEEAASIVLSGAGATMTAAPGEGRPRRGEAADPAFATLRGAGGRLDVSASTSDLEREFPEAARWLGRLPVAGLMGCSRLVGMECPGLHSLFTALELELAGPAEPDLSWRVTRHGAPIAPLAIAVRGAGWSGTLQAFVRPRPVAQPSMAEVGSRIAPRTFAGQRALIIGGSRGLGELAAKALAAGGAEVAISYRSGGDDAAQVARDIASAGGACRVLQLDAERPAGLVAALQGWEPSHLYYFATPKIGSQRAAVFDDDLYRTFHGVYVTAFTAVVRALAAGRRDVLHVFYPSTVFVDEAPKGFAEYVAAKLAGEAACAALQAELPALRVVVDRLPRMETDQTASLLPQPTTPALREIERVLRRLHARATHG